MKLDNVAPHWHIGTNTDGEPAIKLPGVITIWEPSIDPDDWAVRGVRNRRTAARIARRHLKRGACNSWPITITVGINPTSQPTDELADELTQE